MIAVIICAPKRSYPRCQEAYEADNTYER